MASSGITIEGLAKLRRRLAAAAPEAKRDLDKGLREVAEDIRADAEQLAASNITRIGSRWSRMRVGVTNKAVYVAPRQRGVKTRGFDARRRPQFAYLMEERAMAPALEHNKDHIDESVERLFSAFAERWNSAA